MRMRIAAVHESAFGPEADMLLVLANVRLGGNSGNQKLQP